ncbi:hypothetical protein V6N13_125107 [Hibiscus sabdariffa]
METDGGDALRTDEPVFAAANSSLPWRGKDLGPDYFGLWCRPFPGKDDGGFPLVTVPSVLHLIVEDAIDKSVGRIVCPNREEGKIVVGEPMIVETLVVSEVTIVIARSTFGIVTSPRGVEASTTVPPKALIFTCTLCFTISISSHCGGQLLSESVMMLGVLEVSLDLMM